MTEGQNNVYTEVVKYVQPLSHCATFVKQFTLAYGKKLTFTLALHCYD